MKQTIITPSLLVWLFVLPASAQTVLPTTPIPSDFFGNDLVALLHMSNSTNVGDDSSPRNSDWLNYSVTMSPCAVFGQNCGDFNRNDDVLNNTDGLDDLFVNKSFTVGAWFNMTSFTAADTNLLIGKHYENGGNRIYIQIEPTNQRLNFGLGDSSSLFDCGTKNITPLAWYHFALVVNQTTFDGNGTASCYINGTLMNASPYSLLASFKNSWRIGDSDNAGHDFNGQIADVFIVNRSITQAEITQIFQGSFANPDLPPVLSSLNCTSCNNGLGDNVTPYTTSEIPSTPTFKFTTNIAADCRIDDDNLNYTGIGVNRNCTSGAGTTSHTCSLYPADELINSVDYVYIACRGTSNGVENATSSSGPLQMDLSTLNMTQADAIEKGINQSTIFPATIFSNEKVYLRALNGSEVLATVDKVVIKGNQRWVFNVAVDNEPKLGLFNITPTIYTYDVANLSSQTIINQVSALINATKI